MSLKNNCCLKIKRVVHSEATIQIEKDWPKIFEEPVYLELIDGAVIKSATNSQEKHVFEDVYKSLVKASDFQKFIIKSDGISNAQKKFQKIFRNIKNISLVTFNDTFIFHA